MLNLTKMDFYRLNKTASFKFGLIASFVISFGVIAAIGGILKLLPLMESEDLGMMSIAFPFVSWAEEVSVFTIMLTSIRYVSLVITCLIVATFVNEEQAGGYIKNIAGQVKNKGMLIASKMITIAVISLAVIFACAIGSALAAFLVIGNSVNFTFSINMLSVIGARILLALSVNSIVLFLCTLTRSKSLALVFGVVFGSGLTSIAYSVVSTFLDVLLNISIEIKNFTPDGLASGISVDSSSQELIKAIAVSLCYILVFFVLSSIVIKKRDTK